MRTVLITGGSRGIGRAMVEYFSEKGHVVAFTYKNSKDEAEELARSTGAIAIRADSRVESEVKAAVESAIDMLGHIDCLINNSGVSEFSLFTDITYGAWRRMMEENLDSAFLYTSNVVPHMISRKYGRIINVSSMWGLVGASCEVHYSTAKAALIGFTKSLAKELGPSGITVNAIAPGLIATDMNKALSEDTVSSLRDDTPVMRVGAPSEVAAAAYFLQDDGASFITGDVMNLSGGYIT